MYEVYVKIILIILFWGKQNDSSKILYEFLLVQMSTMILIHQALDDEYLSDYNLILIKD